MAYALAQVLTLAYMLLTETVHPPAGANPLFMVASHSGLAALRQPVFVGVLGMTVVAFAWSRVFPGLVHYSAAWLDRSPTSVFWGGWGE